MKLWKIFIVLLIISTLMVSTGVYFLKKELEIVEKRCQSKGWDTSIIHGTIIICHNIPAEQKDAREVRE